MLVISHVFIYLKFYIETQFERSIILFKLKIYLTLLISCVCEDKKKIMNIIWVIIVDDCSNKNMY